MPEAEDGPVGSKSIRNVPVPARRAVVLGLAVVVLQQLSVISLTFWKLVPSSFGWFEQWSNAAATRQVYSDGFFFPLPPLGLLLEGWLPNQFANPVRADSVVNAVYWLILVCCLYSILVRLAAPLTAAIAVMVAGTLYLAQPYNIVSGYLELMYMFLMIAGLLILKLADTARPRLLAMSAGASLASAFFVKQTAMVPIVFLVVAFVLILHRTRQPKLGPVIGLLAGGFGIVVIIQIWAISWGVGEQMWQNIFTGGGKDPKLTDPLTAGFLSTLNHSLWWPWLLLLFGVPVGVWISRRQSRGSSPRIVGSTVIAATLAFGVWGLSKPADWPIDATTVTTLAFAGAATVAAMLLLGRRDPNWLRNPWLRAGYLLFWIALPQVSWWITGEDRRLSFLASFNILVLSVALGAMILCIVLFAVAVLPRRLPGVFVANLFQTDREADATPAQLSALLVVFATTAGIAIANSFSGALSIESWLPASACLVVLFICTARRLLGSLSGAALATLSIIPVVIVSGVASIQRPYLWWGLTEPSVYAERSPTSVPGLGGIAVSAPDQEYWNQLHTAYRTALDKLRQQGQSPDSTTVMAGPNNAGVIGILGAQAYPMKCPILWWDVCPDNYAQQSLAQLQADPPAIVIWAAPPNPVSFMHEASFRDGQSSELRWIALWVNGGIDTGQYELVADIPTPSYDFDGELWHTVVAVRTAQR